MDLGLSGRVYVLTGASRGLGYATAQALVGEGARVVISARDAERVAAAAAGLNQGRGPIAVGVAGDLADPELPDRLVEEATYAFGRLDGAMLSVGGPPRTTAAQATDEQWRAAFEGVFLGAVRMARVITGRLKAGGALGIVLSSSAKEPLAGLGLSNGLRPGLAGVVKDMADELGPAGVRVFGLMPHRILTDRNRELFAATGDAEAARAAAEASIPLRRLGDPEEFGRVAAFLLSPRPAT